MFTLIARLRPPSPFGSGVAPARSTRSTRGPIALALALFLLVCQVIGGSPLDARPKPEPGRLAARCHPLITRRVVTCSLYLVFKEPTVGRPRAATVRFPACCTNRHGSRPFLGEPSKVTTEIFACQSPWNSSGVSSSWRQKKLLRLGLGATTGHRAGHRLPKRPARLSIHAPGVGFVPLQCLDVSGYWLSRLCRAPNPARAI